MSLTVHDCMRSTNIYVNFAQTAHDDYILSVFSFHLEYKAILIIPPRFWISIRST
jgi:hypothetical protein